LVSGHSKVTLDELLSSLPPLEDKNEKWRREAEEAAARKAARPRNLTDFEAASIEQRMAERISAEIGAEREFVMTVIGEALGEYRAQLIDEVRTSFKSVFCQINESIETLRADIKQRRRTDDKQEPVDIPNVVARRLQ
jgi:hypothetical protein